MEQLVSPDPEVTCIERDEQDNYMMVACDGIYDVMSNEEIVEFINDRFTREENEGNICNNLLDLCLYKVSIEDPGFEPDKNHEFLFTFLGLSG